MIPSIDVITVDVMVMSLHSHLYSLFSPPSPFPSLFFLPPFSIMSEQPQAVCGLAYDLVQRLSPVVRQIDFALDWMELEAGRALYKYV